MTSQFRLRFSVKKLLATVTLLALFLGVWIGYANYKINNLTKLRQDGEIVIIRDETPEALQSVGITQARPFSSEATIELYVTPKGANASVGSSDDLMPIADAQKYILEKATTARRNGAKDIQLILIDNMDPEWVKFGIENSMSVIGETRERYLKRLEANQKSGANINP